MGPGRPPRGRGEGEVSGLGAWHGRAGLGLARGDRSGCGEARLLQEGRARCLGKFNDPLGCGGGFGFRIAGREKRVRRET